MASARTASRSFAPLAARSPCGILLTHTSGFVYDVWNAKQKRFVDTTGFPPARSRTLAALRAPLAFDPGERWEYGIGIDWAGRMVETVTGQDLDTFMRDNIFVPLGMMRQWFHSQRRTIRPRCAGP